MTMRMITRAFWLSVKLSLCSGARKIRGILGCRDIANIDRIASDIRPYRWWRSSPLGVAGAWYLARRGHTGTYRAAMLPMRWSHARIRWCAAGGVIVMNCRPWCASVRRIIWSTVVCTHRIVPHVLRGEDFASTFFRRVGFTLSLNGDRWNEVIIGIVICFS